MRKVLLAILLFSAAAFAANATPTAISTISVAGSTGTVNSTAHGLAVAQAFCIAGASTSADNVCGVVATAAANSFTFSLAGIAACAASCGAVAPAPQIIILEIGSPTDGNQNVHYLCWATTSQPTAGAKASVWSSATTAQNNAIAAGLIIEKERFRPFPSSGTTLAAIKTYVQNDCASVQSQLASGVQPGQFFGDTFDGSGWTQ